MKILVFALLICIFILLKPNILDSSGMWYPGDDQDYFAHASAIVYGQFPSYKNEYLVIDPNYPQSSIGSGLLAVPFVFSFSLIDRLSHLSIVTKRTADNISGSWTQFGFVFASCFYFCVGVFLLYLALRKLFDEPIAVSAVVITILCEGIPLFAFRRPIFSHASEFFLQSLFIFLIIHYADFKNQIKRKSLYFYAFLGLLGGLVYLTRYNNLAFACLMPGLILILLRKNKSLKDLFIECFVLFGAMVGMIGIFKGWPESYNHVQTYKWAQQYLFAHMSLGQWIERLNHVLFGLDWGLIYTAPFIFLGLWGIFFLSKPFKTIFLILASLLIINFYIILIWGSQGGWYGYRYLIAAATPIVCIGVAQVLKWGTKRYGNKFYLLVFLLAFVPFLSMTLFEGNNTTLDLNTTQLQFMNRYDITNNLFQFQVWKNALFHPLEYGSILLKGCFLYLQYLITLLTQHMGLNLSSYFREYPYFHPTLILKVMMLLAIPIILYLIFSRFFKEEIIKYSKKSFLRSLGILFILAYMFVGLIYLLNRSRARAIQEPVPDVMHVLNQEMLRKEDYLYLVRMKQNAIVPDQALLRSYKKYFQLVIDSVPGQADAYAMRGYCEYYLNEKDKAVESFQKAIENNSQYLGFFYNLGVIFFNNGQYHQAAMMFRQVLTMDIASSAASFVSYPRTALMLIDDKGNIQNEIIQYLVNIRQQAMGNLKDCVANDFNPSMMNKRLELNLI